MTVLVDGNETLKPFTAEDKKQFAIDIRREKTKLMLMAGAGNANNNKTDVKKKLWSMLQAQYVGKEIKYAPLRIAVADAMVYAAPNVELEF